MRGRALTLPPFIREPLNPLEFELTECHELPATLRAYNAVHGGDSEAGVRRRQARTAALRHVRTDFLT